jgi:hypothetical protein
MLNYELILKLNSNYCMIAPLIEDFVDLNICFFIPNIVS